MGIKDRGMILAAALLLGCTHPLGLPSDAERFNPPAIYQEWWQQMEDCSGVQSNFGSVAWYMVYAHSFQCGKATANGCWSKQGNRIYLSNEVQDSWNIVAHEELHAILQVGGHPVPPFGSTCGVYGG